MQAEGGALIDTVTVVDIFMQFQRLQEVRCNAARPASPCMHSPPQPHPCAQCTAFLLDVLAADKAEEGFLQTRLLEMNLQGGAPQVGV